MIATAPTVAQLPKARRGPAIWARPVWERSALLTLLAGTAADARVPTLGASGAIAAVLGAYFVLYPGSRVRTWIFPIFLVRIPAWIFLGLWFLYQLIEANFGLFSASANGGGTAFFAHVGGFLFGWIVARALTGTGRIAAQQVPSGSRAEPAV